VVTVDQIVDVATAIARAEGFAAVRMRSIATQLSVWPQAIYNHVPTKEALLRLVAEAALRGRPLPGLAADAPWEDQLRVHATSIMEVLDAFPGLAEFLIDRPLFLWSGELTDLIELSLAALERSGLDDAGIVLAFRALNAHMFGHRQVQAGPVRVMSERTPDERHQAQLSEAPADSPQPPTLTRLLPALLADDVSTSYVGGLDLLIEGVRARVERTARARTA
jgi:AcrR family transcriptional regulator